jgi:hypothetical protein
MKAAIRKVRYAPVAPGYTSWHPPGVWNDIRQRTTSNPYLDKLGRDHDLESCIHVNPQNPQPISSNMMAATVEAVIGAAYLDGGLPAAKVVMEHLGLLEANDNWDSDWRSLWTSTSRLRECLSDAGDPGCVNGGVSFFLTVETLSQTLLGYIPYIGRSWSLDPQDLSFLQIECGRQTEREPEKFAYVVL